MLPRFVEFVLGAPDAHVESASTDTAGDEPKPLPKPRGAAKLPAWLRALAASSPERHDPIDAGQRPQNAAQRPQDAAQQLQHAAPRSDGFQIDDRASQYRFTS